MWQKYYELEAIRRLRNEGRELLGKPIYITEKRDGENVSIWLDENLEPHISSHNLIDASSDIINRFKATPEYNKIVELLKDETKFENHYIVYGELLKLVGPTRIEPKRKHIHWVLFDIYDIVQKQYLSYTQVYQKAYHYKIPIVKLLGVEVCSTMGNIIDMISSYLNWCKHHRREGIVGKCYSDQIFFKEKIDLPKLTKFPKVNKDKVEYPPMPQERILRALQHAFDIVGEEHWTDVKIAMPIVAQQFTIEAREHNYSVPRDMFILWKNSNIEQIKVERS